jgi:hypothetical protein
MRRFCPSEEELGEYVAGCLPQDETPAMERHLSECKKCRVLVAEAHRAMRSPDIVEMVSKVAGRIVKNLWLIAGTVFFLLSFLFPGYFFQFLAVSLMLWLKWILGSKRSGTVIMIKERRDGNTEKPSLSHTSEKNREDRSFPSSW